MGDVIKLNDKRQRDAVKWVPESLESKRGDGTPDTIEDRIKRIRASLERIHVLMSEMKRNLQTTAEKVEATDENDNRI
jgi:hypothetical protein